MSKKLANLARLAEIQADLHRRLPPPEYIEKTVKAQTAVLNILGENTSENNKAKGGLLTNQKKKAKPTQTESSGWTWVGGRPPSPKEGDCIDRALAKALIEWHQKGREKPTAKKIVGSLRCVSKKIKGGFEYYNQDEVEENKTSMLTYDALNKRINKLVVKLNQA